MPTQQEKLEVIRQACIKANPEKDILIPTFILSDVLLAIDKKHKMANGYVEYLVGCNGAFYSQESLCESQHELAYWNLLKDSLSNQSSETIEFIYQLVK